MFRMNVCCVHNFTEGFARDSRKIDIFPPSIFCCQALRGAEAREEKRRESDCEVLWSIVK